MYETTEKSKKTAKKIVENINEIAKGRKGKGYLKSGKAAVRMPDVDSDVGTKLGEYAENQVKKITSATKKVKENVEVE